MLREFLLNDDKADTNLVDRLGNAPAILSGSTSAALSRPGPIGGYDKAIDLEETYYGTIPGADDLKNMPELSVRAWIKLDTNVVHGYMPIGGIVGRWSGNIIFRLYFRPQFSLMYWQVLTDGGAFEVNTNLNAHGIYDHLWHYVEAEYDGDDLRLFFDGVLRNSTTGTSGGDIADASGDVYIGAQGPGDLPFFGELAGVGLKAGIWTAEESANFAAGVVPSSGGAQAGGTADDTAQDAATDAAFDCAV